MIEGRRASIVGAALAVLLLCAAAAAPIDPAVRARLEAAARAVPPRDDSELKHPVVTVDLGAQGPAAVVLWSSGMQSTFSGAVVTASGGGVKTSVLPRGEEIEGRFELTPRAVFTAADGGGRKALVVLYCSYVNGSGQDDTHAGYVYAWDGGAWRIDARRTARLGGVRTAKAARAKLAP